MENLNKSTSQSEVDRPSDYPELLKDISSADITVYEVLNYTNKSAKAEFLASMDLPRPNFEYGNLDTGQISSNLSQVASVYDRLSTASLSNIEELTIQIIADDVAKKNAFVQDCINYNAATTPEEKAACAESHRFTNEALYGTPDEGTFYALLKEQLSKIDVDSLSPEDKSIYDSLIAEIGDIKAISAERFRPKPETVERFSEMIGILFENFWQHIPEGKDEFTTEEACNIVNDIINNELPKGSTEYHAIMDETANNVSVNHDTRTIVFPVHRAAGNFSYIGLKKIIAHELCTHAYRALVYEKSDVPALSHGLPGNEEIDEGIAKCCEQAVAGRYSDSGIEHYINIGLAHFKSKGFREVFDIQQKLAYLQGCKPGESTADKEARFHAKDDAIFNRTTRCFRGTGELPNHKDLVYYNGANLVWQYIEEHIDDPNLLDNLFLSGKSNIFDQAQSRLIYESKVS